MKTKKILIKFFLVFVLIYSNNTKADTIPSDISKKTIVYKFDIKEEIGPAMWRQTMLALEEAKKENSDIILIHLNTYGGLLDAADSIRTAILNFDKPVWVFIDNNAASAGALISISCDSIYMRSGANIGAATVVNQTGEALPDKYQSYMRSIMRSTAETHGKDTIISGNDTIFKWKRNPLIAEAMVDERKYIEGIIDSGEVLTFTTSEAILHGYCEGQAENIDEVLKISGVNNYELKEYKSSTLDNIIGFLMSPYLQGILIMLMIGGIYFELQTPGIGFPIAVSIIAAILYFAPLYLEGLAENWELIIFIVGIIFLVIEIFAIPGFGVAGITGIILVILGLTLSLIDNIIFDFDLEFSEYLLPIFKKMMQVVISMLISIFLSIILAPKILDTKAFSFIALNTVQEKSKGYSSFDLSLKQLIGKNGIAKTILRPSGKIEIENEIYDAKAISGYIEKDEKIVVIKHEAGQLYVKKA